MSAIYSNLFDNPDSWPNKSFSVQRQVFDKDEAEIMREFKKRVNDGWTMWKRKGVVCFYKNSGESV